MRNHEDKKSYQSITDAVMYLGQVSRYGVVFTVNQLARAMSNPSKVHMGVAKLLCYLAGSINFSITYKREGFKLAAYSDETWGNSSDNGKSTSSYIVMLANGPNTFKVGLQSLTAQSTMEAELVAAALTTKEAAFCSNMMVELGFKKIYSSVTFNLNKTSTLHVAGNRTYSRRAKYVALRYFFVQEQVEEGKIIIYYVNT